MGKSAGISGTGTATAVAGVCLVYAGVRNVPVLQGLRELVAGRVPAGLPQSTYLQDHLPTSGGTPSGGSSALANAALRYVGATYSQAPTRRTGPNSFDCSGLVYRAFRDIGVTDCPPTSATQERWGKLAKIDRSEVAAGDLVFWRGHVVIATGRDSFVGAQNRRRGVITGPISQAGPPGLPISSCRRYTGGSG